MKIVLLLFTLILIFLLIKKNREGFAFIPEANIDFLNKKTACGVLRSSKKYFEYLNKNDLEARQLIYYNASNLERPQTDSIIKHYCDNLLEFTIEEKDKDGIPKVEVTIKNRFNKKENKIILEDALPN